MKKVLTSKLGETFIIRQPAAETNGKYIEIDIEVSPNKNHRPLHYHPLQSEYFKLLEGSLHLLINKEIKILKPGDEQTILPGTHHYYWNEGSEKAVVKTILTPALNFEDFLFAITELEKVVDIDSHGVPKNKLIAAQFINKFKNIMQPSDIPKPVVKLVFPVLSFISKAFGNRLPKLLLASLFFIFSTQMGFSQSRFSKNEFSINGFRNPSIGVEYRYKQVSLHGGYYITNFTSGVTTQFVKTGATYWFLPFGKQIIPSAFYVGGSYLRGLNKDYKNKNAFATEAGVRFVVWKGLNFRLGVITLAAKGQELHVNPTPGISYSFSF